MALRTSPEVGGMGHSIKRKEDPRFIRGKGTYVDDVQLPGMLMTGYAFLQKNTKPSEDDIRTAISGNLCRCTGYVNIVKAVQHAAATLQGGA